MKNFQAFENLQVDRDRRQCLKLFQKKNGCINAKWTDERHDPENDGKMEDTNVTSNGTNESRLSKEANDSYMRKTEWG